MFKKSCFVSSKQLKHNNFGTVEIKNVIGKLNFSQIISVSTNFVKIKIQNLYICKFYIHF